MTKDMELAKRIWSHLEATGMVSGAREKPLKGACIAAARDILGKDDESKRDLIFEALCSAMGADWNDMPKAEQSKYNVAAKQLREIGADPSEIIRRARRYEFLHRDWELTPTALISHWSSLSGQTTKIQARQIFHEPEPEEELVGPPPDFKLPQLRSVDL